MPLYVALVNWTDQGIKHYRDSVRRAEDYRGLVEKHGARFASWSGRLAHTTSSRSPNSPTTRQPPPSRCRPAPWATSGPRR
jgi:hypothetical protein